MVFMRKPYWVFQWGEWFLIVVRPRAIKRCSVKELFGQLRDCGYKSGPRSWARLSVGRFMIMMAPERHDQRIRVAVSAAFMPRSFCTAWKDL